MQKLNQMIQTSVSNVEQLRLCMTGAYNGTITEEEVIKSIKREKKWSPEMQFGTALHAVMEYGAEPFLQPDGTYYFEITGMPGYVSATYEEIQEADKFHKAHPNMTHEVGVEYRTKIEGQDVVIRGRFDGLEGMILHEHKTTTNVPKYETYKDSLQWQIYLLGSNAYMVCYNVLAYTKKPPRKTTLYQYTYQRYPGIENNVDSWIRELIEFCKDQNLMDYITPKKCINK